MRIRWTHLLSTLVLVAAFPATADAQRSREATQEARDRDKQRRYESRKEMTERMRQRQNRNASRLSDAERARRGADPQTEKSQRDGRLSKEERIARTFGPNTSMQSNKAFRAAAAKRRTEEADLGQNPNTRNATRQDTRRDPAQLSDEARAARLEAARQKREEEERARRAEEDLGAQHEFHAESTSEPPVTTGPTIRVGAAKQREVEEQARESARSYENAAVPSHSSQTPSVRETEVVVNKEQVKRIALLEKSHRERMAKLRRLLELAEDGGDDARIELIERLELMQEQNFSSQCSALEREWGRREFERARTLATPGR